MKWKTMQFLADVVAGWTVLIGSQSLTTWDIEILIFQCHDTDLISLAVNGGDEACDNPPPKDNV